MSERHLAVLNAASAELWRLLVHNARTVQPRTAGQWPDNLRNDDRAHAVGERILVALDTVSAARWRLLVHDTRTVQPRTAGQWPDSLRDAALPPHPRDTVPAHWATSRELETLRA
ncbi:hypothetical protein [Lentzea sp. CA-135723]|uniref:hypothetical protein n=1 Tax=Lentzea sp. CA-135723 TaxID=3239950 RepID=UPI003D941E5D